MIDSQESQRAERPLLISMGNVLSRGKLIGHHFQKEVHAFSVADDRFNLDFYRLI